ncbi:uncharacterized protein LOC119295098 isoform X2 [Triticum dicoccoides]|uniref:uncharacterized protein LOC119295098 isoform X2 n=1 Tax=Triticum dicoccoides TaxID=85692 RepID=UPI00188E88B3|nr:uncharacterized protein LOC119295098 isoform X2 [Triticum dicoccoides]
MPRAVRLGIPRLPLLELWAAALVCCAGFAREIFGSRWAGGGLSPGSREFGNSVLKSVNKSTSQFKKSVIRRSGPSIDWFPRKKTESYLKRKIKRLQETDGMTASLHDTLENSNLHYTRMAREKIAASEAARKAMEARKTAMVEASWCRILQTARIQNKEAEELMEKAKLHATEAFEYARVIGIMMYDKPDCPSQQYEVESSAKTGGRPTHKVTASFQTAFEVDMEVAAAVKKAFVKLANSPDLSNQEEFKELLRKISQNPDATDSDVNFEVEQQLGDCNNEETNNFKSNNNTSRKSIFPSDFNTADLEQSTDLVNIMLERIKALREDDLASLAVIVATSGLNAALQRDKGKYHEMKPVSYTAAGSHRPQSRRYSTAASFIDIQGPKKEVLSELPSLDKFLVKHHSKLEREVQEAKEACRKVTPVKPVVQDGQGQLAGGNTTALESASDLGSILVKNMSRLEKEILEAKKSNRCADSSEGSCKDVTDDVQASTEESESLKGQSEVLSDSDVKRNCDIRGSGEESNCVQACTDSSQDKENRILGSHKLPPLGAKGNHGGKRLTRIEAAKLEALRSFCTKDGSEVDVGLDKVFVKPTNRLEMEKRKAVEQGQTDVQKQKDPQKVCDNTAASLDEILVKRVSRLEKEKMEYEKRNASGQGQTIVSRDQRKYGNIATASESLDQVLVKRVGRLEREKMEFEKRNAMGGARTGVQTDEEKHGNNNDKASDSLDQILVKHVSRPEKEKMEQEKKGDSDTLLLEKSDTQCADGAAGGLADIFVKRPTKLEQAKQAAAASAEGNSTRVLNPAEARRRAREKELLDAWGGEGLGSSVKPHLSKIGSDKAACRKSEGELKQERRRAREKELLDAWGGVGLGNSMKPHLSKIEKDKAAWRKLEEEQNQTCAGTTEL